MILWWAAPALAQPAGVGPSPARQCADAAAGAEIEVCLGLAVEYPEAIDSIAAALVAHVDRRDAADRALLDGLQLLIDPERADEGVQLLGSLDDPRAFAPLVATAETHHDRELAVAAVAVLAPHPGSVEQLRRWLVDRDQPLDLRTAAALSLGELGTSEAGDAVQAALARPGQPTSLRTVLLDTLRQRWPDRIPDRDAVAADGTVWIGTGTSLGLGYAMGAVGQLGRTNLAAVGAVTGVTAGATSGYLYARAWPVEAGDAALVTTTTAGGTAAGMLIGSGLTGTTDGALIGGLIGEGVGVTTGVLARQAWSAKPLDAVEGLAVGALVTATVDGLVAQGTQQREPWGREAVTGAAAAAGLTAGHLLSPRVALEGPDPWLLASGAAVGLAAGLAVPVGQAQRIGLPQAGAAAGTLAGYGLAGAVEVPGSTFAAAWTGGAYGAAAGLGLGMMVDGDPDVLGASGLVGATLGFTAGAVAAERDPDPIDDRDVFFSAAATSWAAWDGAAIATLTGGEPQAYGAVLTGSALVGAATGFASNALDVPVTHTLAASSLGLWGGYVGGVVGEIGEDQVLASALVGSNAGLIGGTVLMSPWVSVPPLVVGIADAGGVLGSSMGALVASQFDSDPDLILGVSLGGAALGLAGGAALGATWHRQGSQRNLALAWPAPPQLGGRWSVAPLSVAANEGPAGGLVLTVDQW